MFVGHARLHLEFTSIQWKRSQEGEMFTSLVCSRRVYDALNVLMAVGVIAKDRKSMR
jgi:hypothetical protein